MIAQQWGRIIKVTGLAAVQGSDALAGIDRAGDGGDDQGHCAGVW